MQERPPEEQDKYRILGAMGRNQLGVVYRAKNIETDQELALTLLDKDKSVEQTSSPEAIERFKFDMRAVCKLRHPNIVPVLEATSFGEHLCVVADCLDGESLDELIERKGPLSPHETIQTLAPIATALDHVHSRDLYHGRLRAGSIFVDKFKTPFIRDIAVACAGIRTLDVGSMAYSAPEAVLKEPTDDRSDQYSLAAIAFECLTGQKPFKGQDYNTLGQSIINGKFKAVHEVAPELPLTLEKEFEKAFRKDRESRFSSSQAMIAALATSLGIDHPIIQAAADFEIIRGRRKRKQSDWDLFTIKALRDDMAHTGGQSFSKYKSAPESEETKKKKVTWIDEGPIQKQKKIEMYTAPKPQSTTPGGLFDKGQEIAPADPNAQRARIRQIALSLVAGITGAVAIFSGVGLLTSITSLANPDPEPVAVEAVPQEESIDAVQMLKEIDARLASGDAQVSTRRKQVSEMTNFEIRALLIGGSVADDEILKALLEAKRRTFPDLISMSSYALQSPSARLRIGTLNLLAETRDARAVPSIISRLEDPEFLVRSEAAQALGAIRDKRARDALVARLKKEQVPAVKASITAALLKINR